MTLLQHDESLAGSRLLPYLNRLADLLWLLARAAEQAEARRGDRRPTRPQPPNAPRRGPCRKEQRMSGMPYTPTQLGVRPAPALVQQLLIGAFGWMFAGLLLSAGVAYLVGSSEQMLAAVMQWWLLIIIGQMVLGIGIQAAINKVSPMVSLVLFFVFAAIDGPDDRRHRVVGHAAGGGHRGRGLGLLLGLRHVRRGGRLRGGHQARPGRAWAGSCSWVSSGFSSPWSSTSSWRRRRSAG